MTTRAPHFPLPQDWRDAVLVGRLDFGEGPTPAIVDKGRVLDVSAAAPTVSLLLQDWRGTVPTGRDLGDFDALDIAPAWSQTGQPRCRLLAPVDLQCLKAAGVTFATSTMERVIEEKALGVPERAQAIRASLATRIGADLASVTPGSPEAAKLKAALIADGMWSQYLEVAIGLDAEIFTKSPPLSAVGWGQHVGIGAHSTWNNPEPEIVLVVDRTGRPVGAALGNDVNLRDYEGRSALLLSKAKDNNASCAIGPFIRLFDDSFTLDHVRQAEVRLEIVGADNFRLEGVSAMAQISRDPLELVRQAMAEHHYPDGFVMFCGTPFAPTQDRDQPGRGFTHKEGDIVRISTPKLGVLENRVTTAMAAAPWNFGIADLMRNLSGRGLLVP